jgi:hypothetical protein
MSENLEIPLLPQLRQFAVMHAMALSRHLTATLDFGVLPSILLKCTTHQAFELIEVAGWV